MKRENLHFGIVFLLATIILASCNTRKNMTYLRDLENQVTLEGTPPPPKQIKIRPDDNLYISVKTINPEINELFTNNSSSEIGSSPRWETPAGQHINGYQVDQQGNIVLPIIGTVHLAGLTLMEAQVAIQKQADEYLKDANIQVKLLNYKVNVLGEVNSPGVYYNYNNSLTILEAIGMANGITEYAGLTDVSVIRKTDTGTKSYKIDLTKKNVLKSDAYYIYPNDVIYIEPQSLKNTRLNSGMYALFLSSISTAVVILKYLSE
jgi:polysaccharide export outer membrane protein